MQIVIFSHPVFMGSRSMNRYAAMLEKGLRELGHETEVWTAIPILNRLPLPSFFKKWLGYADQFLIFPLIVRIKKFGKSKDTLYVISDNGLGPWVRLVAKNHHVLHCHDFLAQDAAMGKFPEYRTSFTGKLYQKFIRSGYTKARNFISVSEKTRSRLNEAMNGKLILSELVYNGIDSGFSPFDSLQARKKVSELTGIDLSKGYLLHIGATVWYKNKKGLIRLYNEWRKICLNPLPLIMAGNLPDSETLMEIENSTYAQDIIFPDLLNDENIRICYSGASLMIFPSLYEGFGWPIAEAMACGCPVLTTGEAPMNEVGGDAAYYIPRMPYPESESLEWAKKSAEKTEEILNFDTDIRSAGKISGLEQVKKFDLKTSILKTESVYKRILDENL